MECRLPGQRRGAMPRELWYATVPQHSMRATLPASCCGGTLDERGLFMNENAIGVPGDSAASSRSNRWTVRDVLTFVVFTVVLMILNIVLKLAEDLVLSPQNTLFVGSWLFPLVATPFYLVMADRIGKHGVLAGHILAFGVMYSFFGGVWAIPIAIAGAIIGELVMWGKGSYRNVKRATGGYYVFWVTFACFGIVPYLLFREAYIEQLSTIYSVDAANTMIAQYTELPWILLMLVLFAVGTVVGGVIGAKFLKKHVRKAKIA